MSRPKSHKRDRERAHDERNAAKAARRLERRDNTEPASEAVSSTVQSEVLAALAELHRRFSDGEIEFDDFDAAKRELTERLDVH